MRKDQSPFRLVLNEVPEQHWRVDFSSGFPLYQELTREEAALHLEAKDALLASGGEFFGDWGGIWNSIKEGASSLFGAIKDFVVTTIIDPITGLVDKIRTVFTLLVEGVDIDGCDISADMLVECRRAATAAGHDVRLYAQPMHALDVPRRYRTIYICDSFGLAGSQSAGAR